MHTLRSDEKHNNRGVFYALPGELIPQLSYNSPGNPPNVSHGVLSFALTFYMLSWSMTRHDTQGLPRPDPRPQLNTPLSYQVL